MDMSREHLLVETAMRQGFSRLLQLAAAGEMAGTVAATAETEGGSSYAVAMAAGSEASYLLEMVCSDLGDLGHKSPQEVREAIRATLTAWELGADLRELSNRKNPASLR